MEAGALPTIPLLALSKTLRPFLNPYRLLLHNSSPFHSSAGQSLLSSPSSRCFLKNVTGRNSKQCFLISFAGNILRSPPSPPIAARMRTACVSNSVAGGGAGGGGSDEGTCGGGGGGGGGDNGGETETKSIGVESEDTAALGADVIVLDVGGMSCGGCAASVKRILESQPQVSSASVNLATETAVVWANPDVKVLQNWQQQLGEKLANHLTICGFKSNLRGQGHNIERKN